MYHPTAVRIETREEQNHQIDSFLRSFSHCHTPRKENDPKISTPVQNEEAENIISILSKWQSINRIFVNATPEAAGSHGRNLARLLDYRAHACNLMYLLGKIASFFDSLVQAIRKELDCMGAKDEADYNMWGECSWFHAQRLDFHFFTEARNMLYTVYNSWLQICAKRAAESRRNENVTSTGSTTGSFGSAGAISATRSPNSGMGSGAASSCGSQSVNSHITLNSSLEQAGVVNGHPYASPNGTTGSGGTAIFNSGSTQNVNLHRTINDFMAVGGEISGPPSRPPNFKSNGSTKIPSNERISPTKAAKMAKRMVGRQTVTFSGGMVGSIPVSPSAGPVLQIVQQQKEQNGGYQGDGLTGVQSQNQPAQIAGFSGSSFQETNSGGGHYVAFHLPQNRAMGHVGSPGLGERTAIPITQSFPFPLTQPYSSPHPF